ncbi:DUF2271 domain-containing protein [Shewanella litorisediminis]|uniref:DUF2271 domain-containing protein n=1 Tax=Shewanella litorisediminis TaxID=1173586 RepID=A0ABX7G168_9GAMM|nr:DUF2271 domain-containing protein [Shewanella litorisediminis]MCL2918999.1 DUF2271 domain-containing protein [Shewanella litorisediminis]QRH01065.1 DUF2271 domain-containing protein [Shewanella litorisediminis]
MKLKPLLLASVLCGISTGAFAQMQLELSLKEIATGQYHRPYTAIWVENSRGESVKTLALWVQHDGHKWFKDIRRWWRKAGRDNPAMVDAVSSATRPAGKYHLDWDLSNDEGKPLAEGDYQLFIEVVREHGGRELIRHPFNLPGDDFNVKLPATSETGESQIHYSRQAKR